MKLWEYLSNWYLDAFYVRVGGFGYVGGGGVFDKGHTDHCLEQSNLLWQKEDIPLLWSEDWVWLSPRHGPANIVFSELSEVEGNDQPENIKLSTTKQSLLLTST